MADVKRQSRSADGRYDYDGRLERLCVCGHTLGDHAAVSPHECFRHTMSDATAEDKQCKCERFRETRRKKVSPP
jgi:hypothetical protein